MNKSISMHEMKRHCKSKEVEPKVDVVITHLNSSQIGRKVVVWRDSYSCLPINC